MAMRTRVTEMLRDALTLLQRYERDCDRETEADHRFQETWKKGCEPLRDLLANEKSGLSIPPPCWGTDVPKAYRMARV